MKISLLSTIVILFIILASSVEAQVINFEHTLESDYSTGELWQDFNRAMKSSKNSNVWPSASSVIGEGLVDNGIIEVTYSMGFFSPTYSYILSVNEKEKSFSYTAFGQEHPFIGGATVQVLSGKTVESSRLLWKGTYDTAGAGFFARRAFLSFERRFFEELKRRLLKTP